MNEILTSTTTAVIKEQHNVIAKPNLPSILAHNIDLHKDHIRNFSDKVTENYILKKQQEFHNNLSWKQKHLPFVREPNKATFDSSIALQAKMMSLGFNIGVNTISGILNSGFIEKTMLRNTLKNSYKTLVANSLFISGQDFSTVQDMRLTSIFQSAGIKTSQAQRNKIKEKAIATSNFQELPTNLFRSKEYRAMYLNQLLSILGGAVIQEKQNEYSKLSSFACDYLGFTLDEFNTFAAMQDSVNDCMSLVVQSTQFSAMNFVGNIISEITDSSAYIDSLVQNDPFHQHRTKTKKTVTTAAVIAGHAALTTVTGPVGDMLLVASGALITQAIAKDNPVLANKLVTEHTNLVLEERKAHRNNSSQNVTSAQ